MATLKISQPSRLFRALNLIHAVNDELLAVPNVGNSTVKGEPDESFPRTAQHVVANRLVDRR